MQVRVLLIAHIHNLKKKKTTTTTKPKKTNKKKPQRKNKTKTTSVDSRNETKKELYALL